MHSHVSLNQCVAADIKIRIKIATQEDKDPLIMKLMHNIQFLHGYQGHMYNATEKRTNQENQIKSTNLRTFLNISEVYLNNKIKGTRTYILS